MDIIKILSKSWPGLLVIGVATWWIMAPKRYVACIRKLPLFSMSSYPMSSKPWFPRYLRLVGIFLWAVILLVVYVRYYVPVH